MKLGAPHSAVWQPNVGDPLQFTPPARTICFREMPELPDVASYGDDLDARDLGQDLEVAHSPRLAFNRRPHECSTRGGSFGGLTALPLSRGHRTRKSSTCGDGDAVDAGCRGELGGAGPPLHPVPPLR